MLWCLFVDDILLIAPSERKMKALLRHVFCWANKNEKWNVYWYQYKCATMVVKPLKILFYILVMKNLHFTLGFILSLKNLCVYFLRYPRFSNDLSLELIIIYMNTKVRKSLFSFSSFLSNKKVPLTFNRSII
jgi:hypothetical protein